MANSPRADCDTPITTTFYQAKGDKDMFAESYSKAVEYKITVKPCDVGIRVNGVEDKVFTQLGCSTAPLNMDILERPIQLKAVVKQDEISEGGLGPGDDPRLNRPTTSPPKVKAQMLAVETTTTTTSASADAGAVGQIVPNPTTTTPPKPPVTTTSSPPPPAPPATTTSTTSRSTSSSTTTSSAVTTPPKEEPEPTKQDPPVVTRPQSSEVTIPAKEVDIPTTKGPVPSPPSNTKGTTTTTSSSDPPPKPSNVNVISNNNNDNNAVPTTVPPAKGETKGAGSSTSSSTEKSSTNVPVVATIAGSTVTAGSSSELVVDTKTIKPGGPEETISNTVYSLGKDKNLVVDGKTTQKLSTVSATPVKDDASDTKSSDKPPVTTAWEFDDQTMKAGGPAVTVNSYTLSLASDGSSVVVDGLTQPLKTASLGGGLIISVADNTAPATALKSMDPANSDDADSGSCRSINRPAIWLFSAGFAWSCMAIVLGGCLVKFR